MVLGVTQAVPGMTLALAEAIPEPSVQLKAVRVVVASLILITKVEVCVCQEAAGGLLLELPGLVFTACA